MRLVAIKVKQALTKDLLSRQNLSSVPFLILNMEQFMKIQLLGVSLQQFRQTNFVHLDFQTNE